MLQSPHERNFIEIYMNVNRKSILRRIIICGFKNYIYCLDCFASLAMTIVGQNSSHSKRHCDREPKARREAIQKRDAKLIRIKFKHLKIANYARVQYISEQSGDDKRFSVWRSILILSALVWFSGTAAADSRQIYVFVSSSIPQKNLIEIMREAKAHEAAVVLQGLIKNSFEKTVKFLAEIIQKSEYGVIIDPTLFEEYAIVRVPSFVIVRASGYDKISGNITLKFALEQMEK